MRHLQLNLYLERVGIFVALATKQIFNLSSLISISLSLSLSQVICHDLRHHLTTSSLDYLFYTQLCHSYTHQTCAADNYYKFLYHATTDIL